MKGEKKRMKFKKKHSGEIIGWTNDVDRWGEAPAYFGRKLWSVRAIERVATEFPAQSHQICI